MHIRLALAIATLILTAGAAAPTPPPRLPEDPVAGKRSEEQWRAHMREEEEHRQLAFDRRRLKQHRAVVRLLTAARARYDRARSEAEVTRVSARMPAVADDVRRRMKAIDPWGNNSRPLADYEALLAVLATGYPAAKRAALAGDGQSLAQLRTETDERFDKITRWLAEAAETEDE